MNIREINARIAENLFNIEPRELNVPDYTEWKNVEPVLNWLGKKYKGRLELGTSNIGRLWWVNAPKWSEVVDGQTVTHWTTISVEETLPLAICVAALKAAELWSEDLRYGNG